MKGYLQFLAFSVLIGSIALLLLSGVPATDTIQSYRVPEQRVKMLLLDDRVIEPVQVPPFVITLVDQKIGQMIRRHREEVDAAKLVRLFGRAIRFEGLFKSVVSDPADKRNLMTTELGLGFSKEICQGNNSHSKEIAYELIRRAEDDDFVSRTAGVALPDDPPTLQAELFRSTLRGLAAVCLAEYVRSLSSPKVNRVG